MLAISHPNYHPNLDKFFERVRYDPFLTQQKSTTTTSEDSENIDKCNEKYKRLDLTLDFLQDIQKHCLMYIPFENFNLHFEHSYFKANISTDPDDCPVDVSSPELIEKKIVDGHRGGYCFELNQYLHYVLRELGFSVTPVMARVRWQRPVTTQTSRSHLLNIVQLKDRNETYIVDIAFGPPNYVFPLRIDAEAMFQRQATKYEIHRVVPYSYTHGEESTGLKDQSANHYMVQVLASTETNNSKPDEEPKVHEAEVWQDIYFFDTSELSTVSDWFAANWYVATWPRSLFINHSYLSIIHEDVKYTLFDNTLIERKVPSRDSLERGQPEQEVIRTVISSKEEYLQLLVKLFYLPEDTVFGAWKEALQVPGIDKELSKV